MLRFTMCSIVLLVSSLPVTAAHVVPKAARIGEAPKDPDAFMLVGRISPDEVGPYQGSAITVYRVQRGKLAEISLEKAESDREGRYHVAVRIPAGETPDLVVEAKHPSAKGNG